MVISIRSLTKIYRMGNSEVRALDGVDLDIRHGEFVSLVGPSGSGKSTMMHLLGCLDRPTAGTFELDGERIDKLKERDLARVRNQKIGFVFQTFNLVSRVSAIDNVCLPMFYARKSRTRKAGMAALEKVDLANRARHVPAEMSGGERQRVAIARALVNDPSLILADEPTGNLDSKTGDAIMNIFHGLHAVGTTVVLVTHEPDIAEQAERTVRMRDGKIVEDVVLRRSVDADDVKRAVGAM